MRIAALLIVALLLVGCSGAMSPESGNVVTQRDDVMTPRESEDDGGY